MNRHGNSSRFAGSEPLSTRPKIAEQAEIDAQVAAYLAKGGRIQRVAATPYIPAPFAGRSHELDAASRKRGGETRARHGNRGNAKPKHVEPRPLREQELAW
jgi:hypothetical protein